MKPLTSPRTLLLIFFAALLLWPLVLRADESSNKPVETAPNSTVEQSGPPPEAQNSEDLQALRQRYGQDPTGVRARLGMCRRGHGGGLGNGRGHGRGRGAMHGPQHPCPYGEQQWNKQP
ncbi:MAG: hypothetical protein AB7U29_12150 [Desulfobulbus sp.]